MSIELHDYRGKITPETDAVLEAQARAQGVERQVIARDVLHRWAVEQIHAATVLHGQLLAQGLPGIGGGVQGASRGVAGNRGECEGVRCQKGFA